MEAWFLIGGLVAAVLFLASRRSGVSKAEQAASVPAILDAANSAQPQFETTRAARIANTVAEHQPSANVVPAPQAAILKPLPAQQTGTLQPLKNAPRGRFVILDFETTGLSPSEGARVIEVSAREVVDGKSGQEFLTFIDPGVRVPAEITQITGITTQMLRGAPRTPSVMKELATFIGVSPIVGHNIAFDRKFLEWEADEFLAGRSVRTLCTLLLARRVFPGHASYRLGNIMQEVGIRSPERLHRASADTWVTAHLFDRICEHARSRCGPRLIDHDLLDRLQRVKIATAHNWLSSQASTYVAPRVAR